MNENPNAPEGGNGEGEGGKGFAPITSQEALDKVIGDRLTRQAAKFADYDDLKAKASKFDAAENASKSELQKEREAREAAEKRAESLEANGLRIEIAATKGLSVTQAKRLVGTTREELEKDADDLLAEFKPAKRPAADSKQLKSGSGSGQETGKDRAAAALRQLRGH